jgi:lysozyme family protein
MDRFFDCLPFTLAQECPFPNDWSNPRNFSDDAHDPGGETMCGIIQREYDAYRKHLGFLVRDVRQITKGEGYDIYRGTYWLPHGPLLPAGLDLNFFDACVNEGSLEAVRILQAALGLHIDGDWGPQTSAAVGDLAARGNAKMAILAYTERREAVYRAMRGFQYFGRDWIRRSQEIGAQALKMAA